MKKLTQFAQLQGWNEPRQLALVPLLLKDKALIWFDSLADQQKETFEVFKDNLFKRYRPHEATRWLRLRQFADRRQQPHEPVEDYFQVLTRQSQQLGKTTTDIVENIVAGLLPAISRFVITRNPKTIDEALDFARTAGVLEQDGSNDKVGVALASLTDQIGALQMDLNRMQNGMRTLVQNRPQSARRSPASQASATLPTARAHVTVPAALSSTRHGTSSPVEHTSRYQQPCRAHVTVPAALSSTRHGTSSPVEHASRYQQPCRARVTVPAALSSTRHGTSSSVEHTSWYQQPRHAATVTPSHDSAHHVSRVEEIILEIHVVYVTFVATSLC